MKLLGEEEILFKFLPDWFAGLLKPPSGGEETLFEDIPDWFALKPPSGGEDTFFG